MDQLENEIRLDLDLREYLYNLVFMKISLFYTWLCPKSVRRIIELILLVRGLWAVYTLIYFHTVVVDQPSMCLDHVKDKWPREGLLRIEIISSVERLEFTKYASIVNFDVEELNFLKNSTIVTGPIVTGHRYDVYVYEYALDYGLLRTSSAIRKKFNISVMVVTLDSEKEKCFGDSFTQKILKDFLGYNDLIMLSVGSMVKEENYNGYLRNVITDKLLYDANVWKSRSTYLPALLHMLFNTILISTVLRQVQLKMFSLFYLEGELGLGFDFICNAAPDILIVALSLIGVEYSISLSLYERNTTYYVIVMIWLADQFVSIFCRTNISKKHWYRFFYLYLYVFYAYHYRFGGLNNKLALVAAWHCIEHSMIYFYHRFELPLVLQLNQNA